MRPNRLSLRPPARGLLLACLTWLGCPARQPPPPPPAPRLAPEVAVALVLGEHDTLDGARKGLEAALQQRVELPLPFPRVEHHGDRYRVVVSRGKGAAVQALFDALKGAGANVAALPLGEGGNDDVVRLGILCTAGETVPLYAAPLPRGGAPRELARLTPGQVVVPAEDDDGEGEGGEAERGFVKVLAPQAGFVRGPDLLLPADCTPRDEDNDDGNGRLLAGGRLCLTTRFSGKEADVPHATLLAVAPTYRRCTRFPEAGTFDGFDQSPAGTQFAVEVQADKAAGRAAGLAVYDVAPTGALALRFQLPGLSRPAYLGDTLTATEDGASQALVVLGSAVLSGKEPPVPRRLAQVDGAPFAPQVPTQRPAAPTLQAGRAVVSFHKACDKAEERRVREVARGDFEQCLLEVELSVTLIGDGKDARRRCQLNNAPSALEQAIPTPCR